MRQPTGRRFIEASKAWVQLDIFGWGPEARPGRLFGGTDQASERSMLKQRYS